MKRLTVASIQPPEFVENRSVDAHEKTVASGLELLGEAMRKNAVLCCLPEYFNVFNAPQEQWAKLCSNADSLIHKVSQMARESGSAVVLPLLVQSDGAYLNRAIVINDSGQTVGHYDKIHPTIAEKQQLGVIAGDEVKTFDMPFGRLAVAICYDVYFPRYFTELQRKEVDIIALPSLQRSEHEIASDAMLRTRAMDTQAYVVRSSYGCPCNDVWNKGNMFGQSCIIHPDGTMLANAGHYEGLALAHAPLPYVWKRNRCGGYPQMPVREFLLEDETIG